MEDKNMNFIHNNGNQLWNVCLPIAENICKEAKEHHNDINSTVHAFRVLAPFNNFDIVNWDDAINYIAFAIYNFSLYYISKNIPRIVKTKLVAV